MSTNTNTTSDIFTIRAAPGTDIWRKPPTTNIYNAPTAIPPSARSTGPLTSFLSARASFSFPWRERYDQAGILLAFRRPHSSSSPSSASSIPPKWIKTGIEFYQSQPQLSTVATDTWADWSVTPLLSPSNDTPGEDEWTTILVEKSGDEHGKSIWVYRLVLDEETGQEKSRTALREICWVYGLEDLEGWELEVVAMAARPERNVKDGEELVVRVKRWEVKWE
ncbi:hypothetical protein B0T20DRAFT_350176 [Sordaria brevicollis]|uniref:Uncharacterized protein n=1 Tax=Sordaria brevicollis TaxID=83679 RepID=A0AAE0PIB1_SORBR|nr:hypothetical protein B0T20DRAFT_350176 [Sordaria brevicollis]